MAAQDLLSSLPDAEDDFLSLLDELHLLLFPRRKDRQGLKEHHIRILQILGRVGTTIVGNITREMGDLPAQTSRNLRRLELREIPLVLCTINAKDRRKIDVTRTKTGERVHQDLQISRKKHLAGADVEQMEKTNNFLRRLINMIHGRATETLGKKKKK